MKRKLVTMLISILMLLMALVSVEAQQLKILTEEDPPYSFTGEDGKPTGFGVAIVSEIKKRIGSEDSISIYPWARAYNTIVTKPNIVVFTMTRTKERENLLQWVGPIVENNWVFIGKKGSGVKLSNLEDAKKLKMIGVVRDYAWTKYLLAQGFKNLSQITERGPNVKKLMAGRVQAFVSADSSYKSEIVENGLDPEDFEILLSFNKVQMYIAHSKDTDKGNVDHWQSALDDMKKDGTFSKILSKWLPENKMPGAPEVPVF